MSNGFLRVFLSTLISLKFMITAMTLDFNMINFLFLYLDVPRFTSDVVYVRITDEA